MGFMRLYAYRRKIENLWDVPSLYLQKFMAEEFEAVTKLSFSSKSEGEKAGILVMGWDYSYLSLVRKGDNFDLVYSFCIDAEQGSKENEKVIVKDIPGTYREGGAIPSLNAEIYLKVKVEKGALCKFSYSYDNKKYNDINETFKARQGKWIGAKLGLFVINPDTKGNNGWLDCDWFRINK